MTKGIFAAQTRLFKALAHPKRLEIISSLQDHALTASEIEHMTGFAQANLSQHLHILKMAKVIVADREGKNIKYRITHKNFLSAIHLMRQIDDGKRLASSALRVKDVVCGMQIAPASSHFSTIYKGATYFFCASGCQKNFLRSPESYV